MEKGILVSGFFFQSISFSQYDVTKQRVLYRIIRKRKNNGMAEKNRTLKRLKIGKEKWYGEG